MGKFNMLLFLCFIVAAASGQENVDHVTWILSTIESVSQNIRSIIPDWYNYAYDGITTNGPHQIETYISDGGDDMYDVGNKVKFYADDATGINFIRYNEIYRTPLLDYGSTSSHPFAAIMWIKNEQLEVHNYTLHQEGNLGADGRGSISTVNGFLSINGLNATYYTFQVYNAPGDPSICEVYFYIESRKQWKSVAGVLEFEQLSVNTDQSNNNLRLTGRPQNVALGYILLSRNQSSSNGGFIPTTTIEQTLRIILTSLSQGTCESRSVPDFATANPRKSSYFVGDSMTYTCRHGYELIGATSSECCLDRSWSNDLPSCDEIICENRNVSEFATASSNNSSWRLGDSVTYTCMDGYELIGEATSECLSNRSWSNQLPICREITCDRRIVPDFATADSGNSSYFVGESVTYTCRHGYELIGETSSECRLDGNWSNSLPSCDEIICENRDVPEFATASSNNSSWRLGDSVTYTCMDGYELIGEATSECFSNRSWSNQLPICREIICENRDVPEFATASSNNSSWRLGDSVTYTCMDGYELIGEATSECLSNRSLSNKLPNCRERQVKVSECSSGGNNNQSCFGALNSLLEKSNQSGVVSSIVRELTSSPENLTTDSIQNVSEIIGAISRSSSVIRVGVDVVTNIVETVDNLVTAINFNKLELEQDTSDDTETRSVSNLLNNLHNLIENVDLNGKADTISVVSNTINLQITGVNRNNRTKRQINNTMYSDVVFDLNTKSDENNTGVIVDIPSQTIDEVARESSEDLLLFYVTLLKNGSFLDNKENISEVVSIGSRSNIIDVSGVSITFNSVKLENKITEVENDTFKENILRTLLAIWDDVKLQFRKTDDDCHLEYQRDSTPTYKCKKFASYAVLFSSTIIPSAVALTVVSYVGCGISIFCLSATVFIYMWFKELRKKPTTTALMNICICLIAVYLLFTVGVGRTEDNVTCDVMALLLQYVTLCCWCWMCTNAFEMYRAFSNMVTHSTTNKKLLLMYLFSYGVPFVIVIINYLTVFLDVDKHQNHNDEFYESSYRYRHACWLHGDSFYWGFLLPVGIALAFNVVIFALLLKILCQKLQIRTSAKKKSIQDHLINSISLVAMMGLTWIFGFFLLIAEDVTYQSVMQWLFTLCNIFQGLLIFMLNCVRRDDVRKFWLPCSVSRRNTSTYTNSPSRSKQREDSIQTSSIQITRM